jgi:anaerobic magnesium-protoporphyrin IX monomethyl ester cyclase
MKILLIHAKSNLEKAGHAQMPLGIYYLASYIRNKSKHIIKIFDESIENENLDHVIKKFNPGIIGVSFTAISAQSAYKIAREYKNKIILVAGGPYATFCAKEVLEKGFNFIVYGEGEKTFLELINKLEKKVSLHSQKGIFYRKGKKIIKNSPQHLIKNLDSLPFPARDLAPMDKYEDFGTIMTSRGCPFNCLFCNSRKFWQQKYRSRSVMNIYKELEELVKKYKKKYIFFGDDTFTVDKKKVIKLCKLVVKKKLKFKWTALSRADTISEEEIYWMSKAGCDTIFMGIEAGSEKILKTINKNISLKQIENAVLLCKKYNIRCRASFIIGLPGNYKEQLKSIELMEKTMPENINIHILAVYPGSEIYEKRKKYGIKIKNVKNWQNYNNYYSPDLFKSIHFDYLTKKQAITLCKIFIKRLKEKGYSQKRRNIVYKKGEKTVKTFLDFI